MAPEEYLKRLYELSNKKLILLKDMELLTRAQAEVISEEGLEAMDKLINNKQIKIDEVDKLDEQFEVYYSRMKQELKINKLDDLKIAGVSELQTTISSIMELLHAILELENKNSVKAKALLKVFGDEVKKVNQGKKFINAYKHNRPIQTTSYFIDKKK